MHEEIKSQIQNELYTRTGKLNSAILRRDWFIHSNLHAQILELTGFLDLKNPKFKERIWCIMNDIVDHPKCVVCGDDVVFLPTLLKGYSKTCNRAVCKSTNCAEKATQTNLRRYGAKVSDKTREAARARSGELNLKGRETLRKKYGVDNPSQMPDHHAKSKSTLQSNYGVDHPSQLKYVVEKRKGNSIKFYNNMSPDCITVTDYFKVDSGCSRVVFDCNKCDKQHDVPSETFKWRCRNTETPCVTCLPLKEESNHQHQLSEFVSELVDHVVINDNTILPGRRELDILIPPFKLAIEYDGIYWHSYNEDETTEERRLHLWKTEQCESKGIQLIHIFEHEWMDHPDIVKSRISSILGKNTRIYARKCKIVELDTRVSREFLDDSHIQGYCNSSVRYGLVSNDELVAIMTFGRSRYATAQWELLRFATRPYINVVGGISKLYKHFIKENNPTSVISYADRRWSFHENTVYEKIGFTHIRNSAPGYYYYRREDGLVLHNRLKFQKHKLRNKLETFDSSLTEAQNMFANGYRRIWDCGNGVYEWKEERI